MRHLKKYNISLITRGLLPVAVLMMTSCYSVYELQSTVYDNDKAVPSAYGISTEVGDAPTVRRMEGENEIPASYKYTEKVSLNRVNERFTEERINVLFDMAHKGEVLTYTPDGQYSHTALQGDDIETEIYRTSDRKVAMSWTKRMSHQGYAITVIYDDKNGVYTCIAKRRKK